MNDRYELPPFPRTFFLSTENYNKINNSNRTELCSDNEMHGLHFLRITELFSGLSTFIHEVTFHNDN